MRGLSRTALPVANAAPFYVTGGASEATGMLAPWWCQTAGGPHPSTDAATSASLPALKSNRLVSVSKESGTVALIVPVV